MSDVSIKGNCNLCGEGSFSLTPVPYSGGWCPGCIATARAGAGAPPVEIDDPAVAKAWEVFLAESKRLNEQRRT